MKNKTNLPLYFLHFAFAFFPICVPIGIQTKAKGNQECKQLHTSVHFVEGKGEVNKWKDFFKFNYSSLHLMPGRYNFIFT